MNKDKLTLLGCSSSLVFMLLASNTANAGSRVLKDIIDIEFRAPNVETVNTPVAEDPQHPIQDALNVNSDTIGDLAAAKFGCDCAGHRNQVVQMLQTGTLNLNQQTNF